MGCDFTYLAAIDTPVVFQVQPRASAQVTLDGVRWSSQPRMELRSYTDLYGNPCTRAVLPAGRSSVGYHAVAGVPDATEDADTGAAQATPDQLPDDTLIYTLPSRYCLPDVLGDEAWSRFGALPADYRRVQAVCDYVHGHLEFTYGSSTSLSTAADVYAAGRGVCRDFTPWPSRSAGPEHPGPLRLRVPARHGRAAGPRADGLRRLDGGLAGRPLVDL